LLHIVNKDTGWVKNKKSNRRVTISCTVSKIYSIHSNSGQEKRTLIIRLHLTGKVWLLIGILNSP